MRKLFFINLLVIFLFACSNGNTQEVESDNNAMKTESVSGMTETATLAGGCFWCIEQPFENIDGIISVISGYAGGEMENPSYSQVSSGETKHRESVQITFDPTVISYSEILSVYWKQFDPTDDGGSFADRGFQYTSAVFFHNKKQKNVAENSKTELNLSGIFDDPVITPLIEYTTFYPAEDYHQDFYKKDPQRYWSYKRGSGRVDFIEDTWYKIDEDKYPKPSDEKIRSMLDDLQYKVTQKDATERAFNNIYWDNKKAGIYVDIVTGEPLFSSKDKFKSGSGWPSFTKPIDPRFLNKVIDSSLGMLRVEVRSRFGDAHVGHVFYDGPAPTNLRYCMNSAAMKFIPKEDMADEGYGKFVWLVD